jgi:DNA polymerase III subunit delta
MKANKAQIEKALDGGGSGFRLFLLYGPDESGSRALVARLARAMGAEAERIDLDGPTLKTDPARMADEAASYSLFGGKRFIVATINGDEALPAALAHLGGGEVGDDDGNPVVLVAGALKPTSGLLKTLLNDPKVACFASYPPNESDFAQLADAMAREQGLRIDQRLASRLVAVAGHDRAVLAKEIEKLALYLDASPAAPKDGTHDALDAIGAINEEPDLSGLTDAVLSGRADAMADQLAALSLEGIDGIGTLRAVNKRVQLLLKLSGDLAAGKSMDAVTAPLFWKDKAPVSAQLRRWSPEKLARASDRLLEVERAIKASKSVGPLLADAELLTLARVARR